MSDLFELLTALGTIALALAAWRQLSELRSQQKGWESLKVCQFYDFDPILNEALKKLRDAINANTFAADPRPFAFQVVTVLNYLEGLATGIEQGFYNETVVKQHMQPIVRGHVEELLNPTIAEKLGYGIREYDRLKNLNARWTSQPPPWYTT